MSVCAIMLYEIEARGHDTPCWIWQRGTSLGRPIARVEGKNRNAQRVLWAERTGERLTTGIVLMRQCKESLCVNPEHFRKSRRVLGMPSREPITSEQRRVWNLRKYGITPQEYDLLLDAQKGVCAVCSGANRERMGRRLHVDHDHASGVVRGLLCTHCNNAIGHAVESPERLRALAAYLERGQSSR